MIQTSGVRTTARKSDSFPSLFPGWLQSLRLRREVDPRQAAAVETTKTLLRDALRYLTSRPHANGLGDCLDFGVERSSARCMAQVLRELRLDDVQVVALDSELTPELRQKHWLRKISVARIGDVQGGTADVLRSVEPLIVEQTVFIFDAWKKHEEAFEEFLRAHPGMLAERLPSDSTDAQSFVVTRALTV